MTKNTVLIDLNSIGHAAHSSTTLTVGEFEVQAVFGVIRTLRGIAQSYPDWRIWCLWDGARHTSWRKDLLPEYKENRNAVDAKQAKIKESYSKQVQIIRATLPHLGLKQLLVTTAEADDCAGYLTAQVTANGGLVVLITGDQDWIQLVRKNVLWIDPIRDRRVSHADFFDKTGYFTPFEFLQGKALQGDNSDCIPGVGGIGKGGATALLAQYHSIEAFFAQHAANPESIKGKRLHDFANNVSGGREKFARNMQLMNLIDAPKPDPQHVVITPAAFNPTAFHRVAERLAFRSITIDTASFLTPFRQNHEAQLH